MYGQHKTEANQTDFVHIWNVMSHVTKKMANKIYAPFHKIFLKLLFNNKIRWFDYNCIIAY